jgi:general secretion pathway protein D
MFASVQKIFSALISCVLLASCGTQPMTPSTAHVRQEAAPPGVIPQPVRQSPALPPPKSAPKAETYSVVVNNVSVRELLFALARDAKLNVDIHHQISGTVTLNALNQTLPQLLSRIARQVPMRYSMENGTIVIGVDEPYLKHYKVDYLNMTRESRSTLTNVSLTGTTGGSATGGGSSFSCGTRLSDINNTPPAGAAGASSGGSGNNSTNSISNNSSNCFWWSLVDNIRDILRETDKKIAEAVTQGAAVNAAQTQGTASGDGMLSVAVPGGGQRASNSGNAQSVTASGAQNTGGGNQTIATTAAATRQNELARYRVLQAAQVIPNPETGIISVRATSAQHEKIQEFLDLVLKNAKRQVLIEATIVEVQLDDGYQQGINWSSLRNNPTVGFNLTQTTPFINQETNPGIFVLNYTNPLSKLDQLSATIQLLKTFGNVKVLSSPKISVLNNQSALLRVANNFTYFELKAQVTQPTATTPGSVAFTSEVKTVPEGLVLSVTPQIDDNDIVTMNVRPTITRVLRTVKDPSIALNMSALNNGNVPPENLIPEIQTREIESIMRVYSGQTAVMGGLMEDRVDDTTQGIPVVSEVPTVGNAFKNKNQRNRKIELVIFIRPIVIKEASLNGDYRDFRSYLPQEDFFTKDAPRDVMPWPPVVQEHDVKEVAAP